MSADLYIRDVDKSLHMDVRCHSCSKFIHEGEILAETHKNCLWTDSDGEKSLGVNYEFWCNDGR